MCDALPEWQIGFHFGTYDNDPPESCQFQSVAILFSDCRQTIFCLFTSNQISCSAALNEIISRPVLGRPERDGGGEAASRRGRPLPAQCRVCFSHFRDIGLTSYRRYYQLIVRRQTMKDYRFYQRWSGPLSAQHLVANSLSFSLHPARGIGAYRQSLKDVVCERKNRVKWPNSLHGCLLTLLISASPFRAVDDR
jgi:hypothetical protein